jgi:hypothetical protein
MTDRSRGHFVWLRGTAVSGYVGQANTRPHDFSLLPLASGTLPQVYSGRCIWGREGDLIHDLLLLELSADGDRTLLAFLGKDGRLYGRDQ